MTELRVQLQNALGTAYSLEHELGGGGMSRVFVATEMAFGRRVVVKVLPPNLTAGVNIDRFRREILLAAKLQHPHIVPVIAAGEMDGVPYYTMPFIEGRSLRARLQETGPPSIVESIDILRDLAQALSYAHERGIVHRDIKPDNVLLSGGVAVVTDFGIAKAISASRSGVPSGLRAPSLTLTGMSLGTPAYMAPEQAAGDPEMDHRADIYSFGALAYELLTGSLPFTGRSPQRLLMAHMAETPAPMGELRAGIPPALTSLVMQCMEKEPRDRPSSAADVLRTLEALAGAERHDSTTAPRVRTLFVRALAVYALSFLSVAIIAYLAVKLTGLPDWVLPGALTVMGLGLPAVLFTGYVYFVAHREATTAPALTPGGAHVSRGALATLAVKASPHVSWRRATRGGVLALGAFVVLVAAFMTLRVLGIGPPGSLLAAGKLAERDRLIVADFHMSGGDSSLARVVTEAVRTGLGESPLFTILSPAMISDALRRMQQSPAADLNVQLAREVAQREGAKAVVGGDITPLGSGYVVTMRLVSADSASELVSYHETADSPRELLPTVDKLTRSLRGKAGESLKNVRAEPPLEQVTTSSLEALRKYADGSRANDIGDIDLAIPLLRQAIALDTTFAMGYRKLAAALFNARSATASRDSALSRAYRFRDRLPERERGLLLGDYYIAGPGRNRAKAIAAYEALLARYPDEQGGLNNLALAIESRREYARADSLYARCDSISPRRSIFLTNRIGAMGNAGRFDQARALITEFHRRFPGSTAVDLDEARMLYARGAVDSAVAALHAARRSPIPRDRVVALQHLASYSLARGHLREFTSLRRQYRLEAAALGTTAPPQEDSLYFAQLDIWLLDQPERGVQRMEAELARTPVRSLAVDGRPYFTVAPSFVVSVPYFTAAALYALARHPDRARTIMAQYDADVRDSTWRSFFEPARQNVLGEIALAERHPLAAVAAFRRGDMREDGPAHYCNSCLPIRLARAFDQGGMPDSATVMYERYLSVPELGRLSAQLDPLYLAAAHKRLGELYEQRGDVARALTHYRGFVDLWKTADPELQPTVADVQRRIARLTRSTG
jgi:tetratricopeptide (TPR) repeat protein